MNTKINTLAPAVDAMCLALAQAHADDLIAVRPGRRTQRTFAEVVSSIGWILPMRRLFDANPLVGYIAAAQLRRDLTQEDLEEIADSSEVAAQGLLPCAEPAQEEIFIQSPVRVEADDTEGVAFRAEVKRVVRMAQAVAQMEGVTLFVRYCPNVVVRKMRNESGKNMGKNALRARYGGRLYASDRADHEGSLLAIVTPNPGERTALGRLDWQVPGFTK